ncbi:MAG: ABC transporter permease [Planctomycetota bacterium]|nr:MAG: ABC transporter permease [Planctomycetota bacterium]
MSDERELEDLLAEARRRLGPEPREGAPEAAAAPEGPAAAALAAAAAAEAAVAQRSAATAPAPHEGWLRLRTAGVLTSRLVDLKLSDPVGTGILLLQAPLIGLCVGVAFDGESYATRALQFVLAMVAVWLGTFSACREVVKERLIFLRERRAGVPVRAYLLSKVVVLAFFSVVQCLLLVLTVSRSVVFDDAHPVTVFCALLATCLCANALGLLLSAAVKSQNSLIALVPVALIPQLIFSEAILGDAGEAVERIELAMIASWSYDVLHELPKDDPSWATVLGGFAVLFAFQGVMLLGSALLLRAQDE